MIRQLTSNDHAICQQLINKNPAENLFIIGDIEAYGYEQDFQQVWGDFDENDKLRAVLLRYEQNYIPFADGDFDAEGFAAIINQDENGKMMSGLKQITAAVEPYIAKDIISKREMYYAKCTQVEQLDDVTEVVKLAKVADIPKLKKLLTNVPEFSGIQFNADSKKRNMEKGVARTYYIEREGEMASSVSTAAENSISAMVVAVCTNANHKKQGLATQCLTKLSYDLLAEGKELCLFYDNPEAGKIYKRIGFQDIGYWTMYKFL
ncbi:GNAT family N-acetyltransferase [Radiobacillus sp. PE A8.2]|uniref:GNAT family N-acetyltransferase n=1 Tax=Radiobacillus sp. PE A8.2 TaxID=3380349 RepID=UPI0038907F0E